MSSFLGFLFGVLFCVTLANWISNDKISQKGRDRLLSAWIVSFLAWFIVSIMELA